MGIGEIIRRRREELRLTQDQVADQVDMSKPYLSNIETGRAKNPPSDSMLDGLERVLGFPAGELKYLADLERTPRDVRDKTELQEAEIARLRAVLADLLRKTPGRDGLGAEPRDAGQTSAAAPASGIDLDEVLGPRGNIRALSAGMLVPIINRVAAGYPRHFTDLDYPRGVADEYIRCPDLHDSQAFAARVVGDSMEPVYHEGDIVVFSPNAAPRAGCDCFVRFEDDGGTTFKRFYQDDERTIRLQPLNSRYPAEVYPRERITGLWPAVFRIERLM